jgi:hypothetical protein
LTFGLKVHSSNSLIVEGGGGVEEEEEEDGNNIAFSCGISKYFDLAFSAIGPFLLIRGLKVHSRSISASYD